jgi:hypothetical protein
MIKVAMAQPDAATQSNLELALDLVLEGGQDALDVARLLDHVLKREAQVSPNARKQVGPSNRKVFAVASCDLGPYEQARVGACGHLLVRRGDCVGQIDPPAAPVEMYFRNSHLGRVLGRSGGRQRRRPDGRETP